jgi:hypothetical protein
MATSIEWWQIVLMLFGVLILPAAGKWMAAKFDILKNASALELEASERNAGDREIRLHCELVHKGVDEKLLELRTDVKETSATVTCLDKKMDRLLRQNGIHSDAGPV